MQILHISAQKSFYILFWIFIYLLKLINSNHNVFIQVFDILEQESTDIYTSLLDNDISNPEIQDKILNLNNYWTKKMDTLCVSISRKDLQSVSDYLQYLYASIHNQNQEDAVTYSRLLHYNIVGLKELTGIAILNLL